MATQGDTITRGLLQKLGVSERAIDDLTRYAGDDGMTLREEAVYVLEHYEPATELEGDQ